MQADVLIFLKKIVSNYGKQNISNLVVLKQDRYFSFCLETISVFSDRIMWFSLPYFRYELLSLKVEWQNNISHPTPVPYAQNLTLICIYL